MIPLVDAILPVRGRRGRPRRRPERLYGDRAYQSREGRCELRRRGIQAKIAAPKTPHGSGLGKQRWVVERTIGYTSTGGCASATSAATTSTKPSSRSAPVRMPSVRRISSNQHRGDCECVRRFPLISKRQDR
jgi:hypothetical protein